MYDSSSMYGRVIDSSAPELNIVHIKGDGRMIDVLTGCAPAVQPVDLMLTNSTN